MNEFIILFGLLCTEAIPTLAENASVVGWLILVIQNLLLVVTLRLLCVTLWDPVSNLVIFVYIYLKRVSIDKLLNSVRR
jgi:hypothetical protein